MSPPPLPPSLQPRRHRHVLPSLAALMVAAGLIGLGTGPLSLPWSSLWAAALGDRAALAPHEWTVLLQIRAPRVALGLLLGAGLAMAGAAMQGLFRNPLADPGLIGVSSGAALAAVAAIVLGLPAALALPATLVVAAAAFVGGWIATLGVLRLAAVEGSVRMATLLLAGLALNAIAGAGIALLTSLADDQALRALTFWLFGSLGRAGWRELMLVAPLILLPLAALQRDARALNALLLGEAEAGHLGVAVEGLKRRITLLVVLITASAVALAGLIGFIGLLVPHLIRLIWGPDHRLLLPASALLGAALLVVADTAARTILAPAELPIGVLTAVIGGPFFLYLLARGRRRAELQ
jgi:iron complex transport system permease protein